MPKWDWLEKPQQPATWGFVLRVILKAALLFVIVNVLFAWLQPLESLGRLSLYNAVLPGRERLPYGENPAVSYNLSLYNVPAMFSSHSISRPKAADEYRVVLIGDSGTWGWLLENDDTLAGSLNAAGLTVGDRRVVVYNLGYPIMSLTKDVLLLDEAMRYQPDLIVWPITLESFPRDKQLFPPLVQNNAPRMRDLAARYTLALDPQDSRFVNPTFLEQTIVGQRRALADWLRLQVYGFAWAVTGIDQEIRDDYTLRSSDFEEDISWQTYTEPVELNRENLAFDALEAGLAIAGDVPVLMINEPMFISSGQNSDLRYNAFYPRWAYDAYHTLITETAEAEGWHFIDLWDSIEPDEFTDSPVHLTPAGSRQFAEAVGAAIVDLANE